MPKFTLDEALEYLVATTHGLDVEDGVIAGVTLHYRADGRVKAIGQYFPPTIITRRACDPMTEEMPDDRYPMEPTCNYIHVTRQAAGKLLSEGRLACRIRSHPENLKAKIVLVLDE